MTVADSSLTVGNHRRWWVGILSVGIAVGAPAPGRAQDIEVRAQLTGRALPAAYYQRTREHPGFFEIKRGWTSKAALARQANAAVTGTLPLAVVHALFADSPEPAVSAAETQRALFDGPSENGTVSAFYTEGSRGRFTIGGLALPWVRTDITLTEAVGTSFGLGADARTGDYILQALQLADVETDFGQFDNDGPDGLPNSGDDDGFVDALAIQFAEIAASCGGPAIWPHRSTVSGWTGAPYETGDLGPGGDPISVDDYIMQSAVTCQGTEVSTASTIGHELGHILGLPDYYDNTEGILPEQRRWVMGCWSLMAAGAWGCGTVSREEWKRPTHMSPWEKNVLGWLDDVEVVGDVLNTEFVLEPVLSSGHVLQIALGGDEFLLVEHRARTGFDRDLPAGGILIYHIDPDLPRRPCFECPKVYPVALVEADANNTLIRTQGEGGNRGEAGDVFGTNGAAVFSNITSPSTRLHSGSPSDVTFYALAVENGVARLRVSTRIIELPSLMQPLVGGPGTSLTVAEEGYLDAVGNGDGRYDVGDFRKYLHDHPSVSPPPPPTQP